MFGCKNEHVESCFLKDRHPLFGIKVCRLKNRRVFGAVTPFPSCKSIHPEMNESGEFELLPSILLRGGSQIGGELYFLLGRDFLGEDNFFFEVGSFFLTATIKKNNGRQQACND